jgi:FixJ family two-component response regulator
VKPAQPIVFVVDDDSSVREALSELLGSVGLRCELFDSAQDFLRSKRPDAPACLVLDVRLPGLSGLELQRELAAAEVQIPIIFITGHGDIPMSVRAMKTGAVDFLTKPFRDQELLDAIDQAIKRDSADRKQQAEIAELHGRYDLLTQREREVLELGRAGLLNKHIADKLGTSEITVKIHRAHIRPHGVSFCYGHSLSDGQSQSDGKSQSDSSTQKLPGSLAAAGLIIGFGAVLFGGSVATGALVITGATTAGGVGVVLAGAATVVTNASNYVDSCRGACAD